MRMVTLDRLRAKSRLFKLRRRNPYPSAIPIAIAIAMLRRESEEKKKNISMDGEQSSTANPQMPDETLVLFLAEFNSIATLFDFDDQEGGGMNLEQQKSPLPAQEFPLPAEFDNIATLFDFDSANKSKPWRFLRKQREKQIKIAIRRAKKSKPRKRRAKQIKIAKEMCIRSKKSKSWRILQKQRAKQIQNRPEEQNLEEQHESPFPAEFNSITTLYDFDEDSTSKSWRILRKQRAKEIKLTRLHAKQELAKPKLLKGILQWAALVEATWREFIEFGCPATGPEVEAKMEKVKEKIKNNEFSVKTITEALVKQAELVNGMTIEVDYDENSYPTYHKSFPRG